MTRLRASVLHLRVALAVVSGYAGPGKALAESPPPSTPQTSPDRTPSSASGIQSGGKEAPETGSEPSRTRKPPPTIVRESAAPHEDSGDLVLWWRPFGLYDYLGTAATLALFYAVEWTLGTPTRASWEGPVPVIDVPMRNLLVAETRSQRERADRFSDYGWYASIAYPVAVSAVAPVLRGADIGVVWELGMMNLRSFAVASLITRIPHKLIGRKRPNSIGCAEDPQYDVQCGNPGQNQSFFGGHISISMTGAGLACAHHLHAGLYGNRVADAIGCGGALAVASSVMVMRQRADRHWMSDNLVGVAVGLASGYLLPTVLNYHPFWQDGTPPERASNESRAAVARLRWDIVPVATQESVGAALMGLF